MMGNEFVWPVRDQSKGAWFGSGELKAWALAKMIKHREQDQIIKGHYQLDDLEKGSEYKGCLIGCTLPKRSHSGYFMLPGQQPISAEGWHNDVENLYGIPNEVAGLLDDCFEGQPFDEAAAFAVASIEAIPVGMVYDEDVLNELDEWTWYTAAEVLAFLETGTRA